jgi:hypothetical protein
VSGLSRAFSLREDELRASPTAPPLKPRQTAFKSRWVEEGPEHMNPDQSSFDKIKYPNCGGSYR